jgi:hypothetical protein
MTFAAIHSAKGSDFDDVLPEADMDQTKTPSNESTIAKNRPNFLGMGIRDDIEIFGLTS